MTVKRLLLVRRRIDPLLLGFAGIAFPLYLPAPVAIAVIFGVCGLYVAFSGRRRLRRQIVSAAGVVMLYALFSMAMMAWRGEFDQDNRQLGFMGLLLGLSFIAPGLCLVRRPLRCLVLGARIGSIAGFAAAIAIALIFAQQPDRYDGGGNAAIMGFLVLFGALVAMIDLHQPPRLLPNGLHYLVIASFPIFLTETRAVLVLVPLVLVAEFICRSRHWSPRLSMLATVALVAGGIGLVLVPPVRDVLVDRFVSVYDYYVAGVGHHDMMSGDIRLTMWSSALVVIGDHPFTGVGMMRMFDMLKAVAGDNAPMIDGFKHVHNFILQELLANGVFGLVLLAAIPAAILTTVVRKAPDVALVRHVVYVYGCLAAFGLLHDPFYHELCLSTSMLFLGACLAQFRRWDMLTPAAAKRV